MVHPSRFISWPQTHSTRVECPQFFSPTWDCLCRCYWTWRYSIYWVWCFCDRVWTTPLVREETGSMIFLKVSMDQVHTSLFKPKTIHFKCVRCLQCMIFWNQVWTRYRYNLAIKRWTINITTIRFVASALQRITVVTLWHQKYLVHAPLQKFTRPHAFAPAPPKPKHAHIFPLCMESIMGDTNKIIETKLHCLL